ncbi:triple gene block protein [Ligustrum necrotic ringspot virus]|uniref:Triple gene block protein n=1 Tax=Ligustrum necrotic ringspot virus TaxID=478550 RepID=B0LFB8_9VIRU|nr:triple gene block protein [Ligustrum necrotic ringspot virus]ABW69735.1 triple gene block protein [Ligustrum necrotic ringspot virus]
MDVLVSVLAKYNFERLSSNISPPIVVHSVPGAGKSSLIREIIQKDSRFQAYTHGEADPVHLSGVRIQKYAEPLLGEFILLDEYLGGPVPDGVFAIFADPLQGGPGRPLRAHFIKKTSHRFGKATAQLLRNLDFEVEATNDDVVQVSGLYETDPRDTIIYCEAEIGSLLRAHNVEAYCVSEIRGKTFESVTFVTAENSPKDRALVFQCLTRHRKSLLILSPDASYTSR